MLAASKGYLDVVKALVELKASPDKKGTFAVLQWDRLKCCISMLEIKISKRFGLKRIRLKFDS